MEKNLILASIGLIILGFIGAYYLLKQKQPRKNYRLNYFNANGEHIGYELVENSTLNKATTVAKKNKSKRGSFTIKT